VTAAGMLSSQAAGAAATYTAVEHWGELPAGTTWGVMTAVAVDAADNVYAFQRDEPASKVMVFDRQGKLLRTWGENGFAYPHGIRVLRDGAVWTTDRQAQLITKFDPGGKPLLTVGKKGVAGDNNSMEAFNGVSDVAMAANGDLFVSDGEGGNARVVKISGDGTFIKFWGTKGAEHGQFSTPHCIATDSKGRVWVCDRGNKRLQAFDQNGTYLSEMIGVGTPVSIAFAKDDTLYVAAGAPEHSVTIVSPDGRVLETLTGFDTPHGIAVDSTGAIYVAESFGKAILKYVRK
jgi:sugar lactone lactonase YvrE